MRIADLPANAFELYSVWGDGETQWCAKSVFLYSSSLASTMTPTTAITLRESSQRGAPNSQGREA